MIERFTTTLTCTDEGCEFRLVPVDVDMVREGSTGSQHLCREDDWFCECGERREDYEDARMAAPFDLHVVEWVPRNVRRRAVEAAA